METKMFFELATEIAGLAEKYFDVKFTFLDVEVSQRLCDHDNSLHLIYDALVSASSSDKNTWWGEPADSAEQALEALRDILRKQVDAGRKDSDL